MKPDLKNRIIDKWESIPEFVLNNDEMLFNGIYIPKGAYLTVYETELISFGFRGINNPKILLRSAKWHLRELEFKTRPYEHLIPELTFASSKLEFNDFGEKDASRKILEGIVTGRPTGEVTIVEFEIFYLKESGKEQYTDFEHYDERDEIKAIEYEIDVDCAIMTKFSNNKCVYFDYNAGHELYTVFFGLEELINEKIYSKTHWFDYPVKQSSIKNWKKRNRY